VPRRVLVVSPVTPDPGRLERAVQAHAGADAITQVVVPASGVSRLQWLTNEEDEARAAATVSAEVTEAGTDDRIHATVGDVDLAQAVEDALRTFPADEIVIVTRPAEDANWLERGSVGESMRRFDLPVHHVVVDAAGVVDDAGSAAPPLPERHEVARGVDEATPARLLARVGAIVLGAAVVVIVLVFVVYWLA
jgi:hypothetical protein